MAFFAAPSLDAKACPFPDVGANRVRALAKLRHDYRQQMRASCRQHPLVAKHLAVLDAAYARHARYRIDRSRARLAWRERTNPFARRRSGSASDRPAPFRRDNDVRFRGLLCESSTFSETALPVARRGRQGGRADGRHGCWRRYGEDVTQPGMAVGIEVKAPST